MALLRHVSQPVQTFGEFGPEILRLNSTEARIKLEKGQSELLGYLEVALSNTSTIIVDAQACYGSYCECEGHPSDGRPCVWVTFDGSMSTGMLASAVREAIRNTPELRQLGD